MPKLTEQFNKSQLKSLPELRPGDTIKVHQKISAQGGPASGGKEEKGGDRIQIFEGVVITKKHGKGISATITVRKVVSGVGVERIFPIHSPSIDKIEVIRHGKVRRAKLYYLREAKGKKAKLKNKEFAEAIAEPDENLADIQTDEESVAAVPEEASVAQEEQGLQPEAEEKTKEMPEKAKPETGKEN